MNNGNIKNFSKKNVLDKSKFKKNLIIGDLEIPIRYSHHTEYNGDIRLFDLLDGLKYKKDYGFEFISRLQNKADDSEVSEFKDLALKLKDKLSNSYLDERELLILLPFINHPKSKDLQIKINLAFYELRNNKHKALDTGLLGGLFNYNRIDDVEEMENLSCEDRDIKIRQQVKDLNKEIIDLFYVKGVTTNLEIAQVNKSLNIALNGKPKNDRNKLSHEELVKFKQICKRVLDYAEDEYDETITEGRQVIYIINKLKEDEEI